MQTLRRTLVVVACAGVIGCSDDGGPSTVAPPEVTPLSEGELLEACARVAACGLTRARIGDCVRDHYERHIVFGQEALWASMYRCANEGAGECGAIRQCIGFARVPGPCDDSYEAHCEGAVAYNCDLLAGWERGIDCARGGLECGVASTGTSPSAICGGGPCDGETYANRCEAGRVLRCAGGAIELDDCGKRQLQCRPTKNPVCEGTGRSCLNTHPACDASRNTLVDCVEGYLAERSCELVYGQKACVDGGDECTGTGQECNEVASFDRCDGDVLTLCIDGYQKRVDCKQIGFLGCLEERYGANCRAEPVYE